MPPAPPRLTAQPWKSDVTVISSSSPSRRGRCYFLVSQSRPERSPRRSPALDDRGSASVIAVAMIGVLVTLTAALMYIGCAVAARHRAQSAADLAALAAAGRLPLGTDAACAHASAVARAMRSTVTRCEVDGLDVVVTVDVTVELGRFGLGAARGMARAGPL
jgi:secretion/DNA translocation related TadE-like protein